MSSSSVRSGVIVALITGLVCLLRFPFAGHYPDGWDGADFILAIQRFNLLEQRPHFPGYPVYIFLAHLFKAGGFSYHVSALLPGILIQGIALGFLYLRLSRLRNVGIAFAAIALLTGLFHPMISLESLKVGTETLAGGLLLIAFLLFPPFRQEDGRDSSRGSFFLCGVAVGLMLGARISYWPFIVTLTGLILHYKAGRSAVFDFTTGVIASIGLWLIPLIALSGGPLFFKTALGFLHGHFSKWGGSAAAGGVLLRLKLFIWGLSTHVAAGPWKDLPVLRWLPGSIGTALAVYGFVNFRSKTVLLWLILPYAAWVFLAQNPEHPRHLYPLALAFILCVVLGLIALKDAVGTRPALATAGVLLSLWIFMSADLSLSYKASVPAQVQMVRFVESHYPGMGTMLFCGQSYRMFDLYYPVTPRIKTGSITTVKEWVKKAPALGQNVLFTSEAQPLALLLPGSYEVAAMFTRSRYLDAESPVITLYQYHF